MKSCLVLFLIFGLSLVSAVTGTSCTTNDDCDSGCCLGSRCKNLRRIGERCVAALRNTTTNGFQGAMYERPSNRYTYACPCRAGLKCGIYTMSPTGRCEN